MSTCVVADFNGGTENYLSSYWRKRNQTSAGGPASNPQKLVASVAPQQEISSKQHWWSLSVGSVPGADTHLSHFRQFEFS